MQKITLEQFDHKSFLATVTTKPGVYLMLSDNQKVLYVGKANDLKKRLSSYFRTNSLSVKTAALVEKIRAVETIVTRTETEALLLEQTLIKKERPPYNILFRDDKTYPYIYLSDHKDYPELKLQRGKPNKKGRYFGPYPSSSAVRESLSLLQKVFGIRNCDDLVFKNRSRPCLQYQINRCTAPCVSKIDAMEYAKDVRLATLFLEGKSANVIQMFKKNMNEASGMREYERAARYRDQISKLRQVQESQYVHRSAGDVDVLALIDRAGVYCVQIIFIRDGRLLGKKNWFLKNHLAMPLEGLMEAFLSQFYLAGIERDMPRSIIVSHKSENAELVAGAISDIAGRQIKILSSVRGERAQWQKLAQENAEVAIDSYIGDKRNTYERFRAVQALFGLEAVPERIECFDVSHTMGEGTVASCVVFDLNGAKKSDYRRFNISSEVEGGDDYAAIREAVMRRFRHLKKNTSVVPSIIVIDGGIGQIAKAKQVLEELGLKDILLVGVSKGPGRKARYDEIIIESAAQQRDLPDDARLLFQQIRDEAHRFAITAHRGRQRKKISQSVIDSITGVGPRRKKELLEHFGSLKEIKRASFEEICKVPTISVQIAANIYNTFHQD